MFPRTVALIDIDVLLLFSGGFLALSVITFVAFCVARKVPGKYLILSASISAMIIAIIFWQLAGYISALVSVGPTGGWGQIAGASDEQGRAGLTGRDRDTIDLE